MSQWEVCPDAAAAASHSAMPAPEDRTLIPFIVAAAFGSDPTPALRV